MERIQRTGRLFILSCFVLLWIPTVLLAAPTVVSTETLPRLYGTVGGGHFGTAFGVGRLGGDPDFDDLVIASENPRRLAIFLDPFAPGGWEFSEEHPLVGASDTADLLITLGPGTSGPIELAVGTVVGGDAVDDIVVGMPDVGVGGQVWVFQGSFEPGPDLGLEDAQYLVASTTQANPYSSLGASLTIGNLDGDPYDDLVIGQNYTIRVSVVAATLHLFINDVEFIV